MSVSHRSITCICLNLSALESNWSAPIDHISPHWAQPCPISIIIYLVTRIENLSWLEPVFRHNFLPWNWCYNIIFIQTSLEFSSQQRLCHQGIKGINITLRGESVKHSDAFIYLGVISPNQHISYLKKKVSKMLGIFSRAQLTRPWASV